MRQLVHLLFAIAAAAGLLELIHTFPPEGTRASIIYSYMDDQDNHWLVLELAGGGYAKTEVSREIYQRQRFKDQVRVYILTDDIARFVAYDGPTGRDPNDVHGDE